MPHENTLAAIAIISVIIAIALGVLSDRSACEKRAALMGVEYRWDYKTHCSIKPKGHEGFIPLESYKFIDGGIQE